MKLPPIAVLKVNAFDNQQLILFVVVYSTVLIVLTNLLFLPALYATVFDIIGNAIFVVFTAVVIIASRFELNNCWKSGIQILQNLNFYLPFKVLNNLFGFRAAALC